MSDFLGAKMKQAKVDFLIVGGGIAGLWLLADLKSRGYSVLLCESKAIGAGQTIASQGIIHGGTKYALTGNVSKATTAIGEMPKYWKNALSGKGRVNLQNVKWLSQNQLLWTSPNIASKMTGFFASKVMKSRMQQVEKSSYPELFQHPDFKGNLYQLDEPVLDVPSLLQDFHQQYSDCMIQTNTENSKLIKKQDDWIFAATLADNEKLEINAQQIILSAGEGNQALSQPLGIKAPAMQCRPLQMIMLKSQQLPMIYAHALGVSDKPKVTITSHKDSDNKTVWYIGGEPAEKGVGKDANTLIKSTKEELQQLLSWVDFSNTEWSTFNINRAEGVQKSGKRPDQPVIKQIDNVCVAWPTKLAFAPMLASEISRLFSEIKPLADTKIPNELLKVQVAKAIWNH